VQCIALHCIALELNNVSYRIRFELSGVEWSGAKKS
jgi:hypothetical protein